MTPPDSGFARLSHRAQVLRLRRLARAALEHYDLEVRRLALLQHSYNTIFRVWAADGQRYVLRVNLPGVRRLEQIRAEMAWLAALRRDTGLQVPRPVPNRSGELVTTAHAPGVPEPRHCALFGWLSGPLLAERLTPENLEQLGEITALLHRHARSFALPPGAGLDPLDWPRFHLAPFALFEPEYRQWMPPARRRLFEMGLEHVRQGLERLWSSGVPIPLHADLHQLNLKLWRGRLAVLDFDDCALGFPVQDIGITLYYLSRHPEYPALRAALERGYRRVGEWPETEAGQVETLITGRALQLANLVTVSPNPQWRKAAPAFLERTEARLREHLSRFPQTPAGPGGCFTP